MARRRQLGTVLTSALLIAVLAGCRPPATTLVADGLTTAKPPATTTSTTAKATTTGGGGGGGGGHKPTTTTTRPPSTTTSTTSTTRPTTTTSTTAAPVTTTTTTAPSGGGLLWVSDYGSLTNLASAEPVWQQEQEAAPDRLTIVDGDHGRVLRAELRVGDVVSGGNRAEVYARHASRDTPAADWPDPIGSTRWYGFDLYLPSDFTTDPTGLVWLSLAQWKGELGGQPAIALEVKRDGLELAGASARNPLGPIKRGQWERIVVGVHFDATSAGWVEVYRDGALVLPRTSRATTTLVNGQPDPTYLKLGLYRSSAWTVTHVAQYGPMSIGLTRADVD